MRTMEKFVRSIDDDIQSLKSHIESFRGVAAQVEAERNKLLESTSVVKQKINDRVQQVMQTVELQKSDLLQELKSLKSDAEKEVQFHADFLQLALTEMESFKTSSLELKSKVSPNDITRAAKDVHERAKELLKTHIIPSEYLAPSYTFTPANIDELLGDGQNFIGHLVKVGDSGYCQLIQNSNQIIIRLPGTAVPDGFIFYP